MNYIPEGKTLSDVNKLSKTTWKTCDPFLIVVVKIRFGWVRTFMKKYKGSSMINKMDKRGDLYDMEQRWEKNGGSCEESGKEGR